uniref:RxLR effector protein n=1 Tax=Macrostomum lignano TaxID=282301 RepID=A0A1I8J0Q3_9PLAT
MAPSNSFVSCKHPAAQLLLPMLLLLLLPVCLRQGGVVAAFRVEAEADYPDSDLAGIDDLLVKKRLAAADHSNLDLLKFRLIEAGKLPAAATDEDVARYVQQIVQMVNRPRYGRSVDKQTARHSKRL